MKLKQGLFCFVLVAIVLLSIRFVAIDIVHIATPSACPNTHGLVVVNRWTYGYRWLWSKSGREAYHRANVGDWAAYNQPALKRGESDSEGIVCLGRVTGAPGDTLWYDNHSGRMSTKWSEKHNHPIEVPSKGKPLPINDENIRFYATTIMLHEPHKVSIIGDSLCVSGQIVDSYTFAQDYYWVTNPDTALQRDSRNFGFIPHASLVGKVFQPHK